MKKMIKLPVDAEKLCLRVNLEAHLNFMEANNQDHLYLSYY
jgi:hypothetical protein